MGTENPENLHCPCSFLIVLLISLVSPIGEYPHGTKLDLPMLVGDILHHPLMISKCDSRF